MNASTADLVDEILKLGTPTQGVYVAPRCRFFTLSKNQKTVVKRAGSAWHTSVVAMADCDSALHLHARMQRWLQIKHETLEEALRNRQALHFDVLVLGIVSEKTDVLVLRAELACKFGEKQLPINPGIVLASLTDVRPVPVLQCHSSCRIETNLLEPSDALVCPP